MTKRKAMEYAKKHCVCRMCRKFLTEENKTECIKKHPTEVVIRWDRFIEVINMATADNSDFKTAKPKLKHS